MSFNLANVFLPEFLLIEMTSRCNLRCRYCQKADDAWNAIPGRDQDLPPDIKVKIGETLAEIPFGMIQLTGVGEFTYRDDWVQSLRELTAYSRPVALISNFAKIFDKEELDALLTLRHLMVSVDTTDPAVLRSVRKAVSFSTINLNLVRLRMRAKQRGVPLPFIKINAVLYRENLTTIEEVAYFAIEHRVNEMQFERMYSRLEPPTDIASATPAEAAEGLRQLQAASLALKREGIASSLHGDLVQTLEGIA